MVNVTPEVVRVLGKSRDERRLRQFRGPGASSIRIGVGDVVGVTIFEASPGGLFIPLESTNSAGNFVNLPDQEGRQRRRNISVPYAGSIHAAGQEPRSDPADHRAAAGQPRDRAAGRWWPSRTRPRQEVSVLGDVNLPAKFQVNANGERILDVIAKAGGPKQPGYETLCDTSARQEEVDHLFQQARPRAVEQHLRAAEGYDLRAIGEPHAFMAFGASGENGRFDFADETINLSDALGKAGGLLDGRANPGAVLVYRIEDRETAAKLGVPIEKFTDEHIPVIYQFNLRDPGGFFLASSFHVLNKDVIYIGNAAVVQFMKLVDVVGTTAAATDSTRRATQ